MAKTKPTAVSVIITTFNEVSTIQSTLESLASQTVMPKAVIVVDGGSTDTTLAKLKQLQKRQWSFKLVVEQQKGNRSVGRNRALQLATTKWVASTDAGCVAESTWIEALLVQQQKSGARVVAGYYKGLPETPFETAVVPYALVMPDRVNPKTFLPATRSALYDRSWLIKLGGFDETLADNEDYVLAKKIEQLARTSKQPVLSFASNAIVGWRPRSNLWDFVWMIFRFARGDAQALILRPKVLLIFLRAIVFFVLLIMALTSFNSYLLIAALITALLYALWSIAKNYQSAAKGWYWLPVLQISSDIAVIVGTMAGLAR